jgi:UDP-glucose 4-epimerase
LERGILKELIHDKYCVTGAAGFIGSHICEEIVKQGKKVVCVDNMVAGKQENLDSFWDDDLCTMYNVGVEDYLIIDIGEKQISLLESVMDGVDVVFHNAASKCTVCRDNPFRDLIANAFGSYSVFEAARKTGVKKVIHASTGSVFGGKPKSFYGVSKLAAESYLRAFKEYYPDFRFTSIRYHHVFGPRQESGPNGGVIPIFITELLSRGKVSIHGDGEQERHFTYVKDVVDFNFQCEEDFDGKFVDYAEPDSLTISELYRMLSEMINTRHEVEYIASKPGDIRKFDVSKSVKKRRDFYWAEFRRNLKETIESYAK